MRDPGRGLTDPVRFNAALNDFQRARARASLQQITSRLRGESAGLLSFDDVARRLQVTGQGLTRQEPIRLDAIVGSVGRYNDFTRTFLPRQDSDAQRWAHVKVAGDVAHLPPIDVYQIGQTYFVADGNHRVSIARQEGLTHIDANITIVHTRVPLAPDDNPDTLIVKTEHANFLARTRLDVLRPAADVRVSVPGQIAHVENLIEVHRYLIEEQEQRAIEDGEAVTRWYDEAYMPIVEAIREQGVLRYFPKRTETDLYVWIATHQADLRNQLGWTVPPQTAASSLLQTTAPPPRSWFDRARNWLKRLFSRPRASMLSAGSWSQQHVSARYSQQLFADILLLFNTPHADSQALEQALQIARCEGARLLGLHAVPQAQPPTSTDDDWVTSFFDACHDAGVQGHVARDTGPWLEAVLRRAPFVDALVLSTRILAGDGTLLQLLQRSPSPLLLVPGQSRPIKRLLLYDDGSPGSGDALFAAAYMAEQWRVDLVVQLAGSDDGRQAGVQDYLDLHELSTPILPAAKNWRDLSAAARHHECDLILMGAPQRDLRDEKDLAAISQLLRECDRPLFICS